MSTFKQAVPYWPLELLSHDHMKRVHAFGITGVEMPPREQWGMYRDLGFEIATAVGHESLEDGLNKRENHSRIADELRTNIAAAREYGIPNLICLSGNRDGKSEEEGAANTIEIFKTVAPDAEAAGVTLVMELLNSKVDHPDYQADSTAWGVQVVKGVDSPRVKLLYDIYHMQIMEGDIIRTIRDNFEHIGHFHTAGNPGRQDLDQQQELYYPAIARAIHDLGYRDWVGHEFSPKGDVFTALKQAYDACLITE